MNSRKRWGIIILGCVIGAALGVAPLLDSLGCIRSSSGGDISDIMNDTSGVDLLPGGGTILVDSVRSESGADESLKNSGPESGDADGKSGYRHIRRAERSAAHRESDSLRDSRRKTKTQGGRSRTKSAKRNKRTSAPQGKPRSLRDENLN